MRVLNMSKDKYKSEYAINLLRSSSIWYSDIQKSFSLEFNSKIKIQSQPQIDASYKKYVYIIRESI